MHFINSEALQVLGQMAETSTASGFCNVFPFRHVCHVLQKSFVHFN